MKRTTLHHVCFCHLVSALLILQLLVLLLSIAGEVLENAQFLLGTISLTLVIFFYRLSRLVQKRRFARGFHLE
ncbi:MAG: hypothetical protein KA229_06010 [Chitinophagaceae bacterium]|jgi:hypothetical protein|nr:hypothetical protein [Chitinophagaceae bacterium]HRG24805.1 hypothetical protein [Chitinophagaceae bacterium]